MSLLYIVDSTLTYFKANKRVFVIQWIISLWLTIGKDLNKWDGKAFWVFISYPIFSKRYWSWITASSYIDDDFLSSPKPKKYEPILRRLFEFYWASRLRRSLLCENRIFEYNTKADWFNLSTIWRVKSDLVKRLRCKSIIKPMLIRSILAS